MYNKKYTHFIDPSTHIHIFMNSSTWKITNVSTVWKFKVTSHKFKADKSILKTAILHPVLIDIHEQCTHNLNATGEEVLWFLLGTACLTCLLCYNRENDYFARKNRSSHWCSRIFSSSADYVLFDIFYNLHGF